MILVTLHINKENFMETVAIKSEPYDVGYAFVDWIGSGFRFSSEHVEQTTMIEHEPYDIGYAFLNWLAGAFHLGSEHLANHLYEKAMEIFFEIVKLFVTNRIAVFAAALL